MNSVTETSEYYLAVELTKGMVTELGTIVAVLPMTGFSSLQIKVADRKRPIVLDKESSIIVHSV